MVVPFRARSARPIDSEPLKIWQELGRRLPRLIERSPVKAARLVGWIKRLFEEVERNE